MECFKDVLFRRVNIYHIICLGLLLRVVGLIQTGYIRVDGTIYVKIGESFSRGAFAEAFRGAFPPVYPFFIGLFHLLIPDLELAGNLVSFVFGVILIYIVFVFVKKFFGSQYALVASFFVAIHPFLVRNSVTVLSESVATFLFALSVFFYYRGWIEDRSGDVALSGIFFRPDLPHETGVCRIRCSPWSSCSFTRRGFPRVPSSCSVFWFSLFLTSFT